jgi:Domain of unknown function (DUF4276)
MSNDWAPVTIASVVEGHGEVGAVPKLLHRIAADLGIPLLTPKPPLRIPRSKLIAPHGIENAVNAKASEVAGAGGILVLTDADEGCPAELGPQLLQRARAARADKRVAVVLANREFEAWFLAAGPSLAGQYGFADPFPAPADPEVRRGCKELLTRARAHGLPYKETVDQAALAAAFDVKLARENSPSFDKFYRDVRLVANPAALTGARRRGRGTAGVGAAVTGQTTI